jgi:hypothetical protein
MSQDLEPQGQIYTLDLLERLHKGLRHYGNAQNDLYYRIDALLRELANPNLHTVELTTAYEIELWDRYGKDHLRMVIAVASNVSIAHAAFDAAFKEYPNERLTLRMGIRLLRDSDRERSRG